jgi:glycosyltransferase involved in cell wall biosynthesis
VGDGPARGELERRIAETGAPVELAGAVSQDEIRELYASADVFALSSFREGLPFVLIEALAMRLAVVAPRITGIPELVEHDVTGLLVSPGRSGELGDALERLAGDPDLRVRLGQAGRATVERDYELGREAELMLAAFAAAISDTSSTSGTV